MWENSSEELLTLFESFPDHFRNVLPLHGEGLVSSATTNIYARQMQARFKQTIINARYLPVPVSGCTQSVIYPTPLLPCDLDGDLDGDLDDHLDDHLDDDLDDD